MAGALKRAHKSARSFRSAIEGGTAVVAPVSPLRVYVLGLKQIVDGIGLEGAKPAGWQSLVLQGKNPVASVDFESLSNAPATFKSYNQGSHVQSTASAIAVAESLPEVTAGDFEPRLLQTPSINLMSLWLHGGKDLLIPLDPAPHVFKPYTVYSPADFFAQAADLAKHRSGFDDRPKVKPPGALGI